MRTLQEHIEDFHARGFTVLEQVLTQEEVNDLRENVEKAFSEPPDPVYNSDILRLRMFEQGEVFEELLDQPFVNDFAEAVLGRNCHIFGMTSIKTPRGTGIDNWHVDEELHLPIPEGVELDPRIQIPIYHFTCIYYLVDVTEDMGPTQLIPGSHRSGSHPNPKEDPPIYKGTGVHSVLAKAGDCLIFSGQTWHRGAKNVSDNPRIVQQVHYGRRWVSQRFYPFVNYQLPQDVIDRANPRRKRLLGLHRPGPYG